MASRINDRYDDGRILAALIKLANEARHYADSGHGKEFLIAAIDAANAIATKATKGTI